MMTRPLFSSWCFILLLFPTLSWALNESAGPPAAQSAPVISAPAQTAPEKPVATPASPAKPAPAVAVKPVPAAPAHPLPDKPVAAPASPAKPASAPAVAAKPVPVVPLQPAPAAAVLTAPAKPAAAAPVPAVAPALPAHKSATDSLSQTIDIEIFVREDCQNCDKAKEFLAKLHSLQPHLKIITRDVRKEPAALELLKRMAQNQEGAAIDYPAFVVGGQLIIGYSEEAGTAQLILDTLAASHPANQQAGTGSESCETGKELSCGLIAPAPVTKPESMSINLFGYSVPLLQIGLPLFTVTMGMLDGFNHGSTWVLILMISLLSPIKNRPLMLAIAGTFIAVQGLVYFILMAVWLNLFLLTGTSRMSEIVIACIALLAGAIYFKNYLYFGHNISISSHEIAKPGIYSRIRKIVQAKNLLAALLGTSMLAILVQLVEFSYTSVFPALYTRILTLHQLDHLNNYGYLLLYDLAYMLDDIIVLTIGVVILNQERLHEKEGRKIKLISGLVMVGLGIYLLLARH